jgi:hypothetical protein
MPDVERRTYRVHARLVEARYLGDRREDHDIHLVIGAPGGQREMVVEVTDVTCPGAASSFARDRMLAGRAEFEKACGGLPPQRFVAYQGSATIVGVGFFDRRHGQGGLARNGIELHPVLRFQSSDCTRVT